MADVDTDSDDYKGSAEYTFAYDNVSRLIAQTDPAGSTVHFTYDTADRPLGASYPDGTSTSIEYTLLDKTSFTDRLRQTTIYRYDADRELIGITDPLGHNVQRSYNPAGQLASITDENNNTTTFILDAQSRMTGKQFADGTSLSIAYASALSLPATVTDALGQTTDYTYNADNTVASVSYTANQPTASVSFIYDPAYARVVSMTDGVGTTTYNYNPVTSPAQLGANQLQSVTSPVAGTAGSDTVTYTYDALNRVIGSTVNGQAQSVAYDALGRITSEGNPLDTFTYGYSDGTSRVSEVSSTHGPQSALTYYGPQGDELLEQINIATHSGVTSLAQFGYTYNADNNVTSLAASAPSAQTTSYTYDEANRLVSGIYSGSTPQYAYGYDDASNLTSITTNGVQQSLAYTATNAISASGYDANGSQTSLGGNTYTWDGANRIIAFANAAARTSSSFTYDGLGRVVRIVDSRSGAVIADHSYLWCGTTRCLAHDNRQSGSPVSTQYFNQGVIDSGTPYYYIQDQLGSVTALAMKSGTIAAQYAYDPYGNRSVVSGSVVSDIGYAGYFYHQNSGLELALYRAYDSVHARWLNRDPIGEIGGLNLYGYVASNPLFRQDPMGLWCWGDPIPNGVYNTLVGVADGLSLGLGKLLRSDAQSFLDLADVDTESDDYKGGVYVGGTIQAGIITGAAASTQVAQSLAKTLYISGVIITGAADLNQVEANVPPVMEQIIQAGEAQGEADLDILQQTLDALSKYRPTRIIW